MKTSTPQKYAAILAAHFENRHRCLLISRFYDITIEPGTRILNSVLYIYGSGQSYRVLHLHMSGQLKIHRKLQQMGHDNKHRLFTQTVLCEALAAFYYTHAQYE